VSLLALVYTGLGLEDEAWKANQRALALVTHHLERHPSDVRAVYMAGLSHIRLNEVDRGLEWIEKAKRMDPSDPGTLYNVGCAYAIAGRSDQALDTLEQAIDRSVTNLAWISNDPDWDSLRDHPRFKALLDRLR
jgi:adenylate cyclase